MPVRVLIVDDDANLRSLLDLALRRLDMDVSFEADGESALMNFEAHAPDLVVIDVMMPKLDGWALVERIRAISEIPILMLTAKTADYERARGLDLGADDYLTKPFSLVEFEARLRALLRRRPLAERPRAELVAGDLRIDVASRRVVVRGERVRVTPTEFKIICLLAENANRVVTIEHLVHQVWGDRLTDRRDHVKPYISRLRKKLSVPDSGPGSIETVYGVGYSLVP